MFEREISDVGLCLEPDDSYPVWLPVLQTWSHLSPAYVIIEVDPDEMLLHFFQLLTWHEWHNQGSY